MKILVVASYYKPAYIYGGPAKSIPILCESISRLGHEVVVFTTNANGKDNIIDINDEPITTDDLKIYYFNRPYFSPRRFFFSPDLGRACRTEINNFDLVYISATWTYPFLPAAFYSNKYHIPFIICPQGSFMEWAIDRKGLKKYIYLNLIEKKLINKSSYIHCTSYQEMVQTKKMGFKIPLVTIPNPIDVGSFINLPTRGKLRHILGIPDNAAITLFVGRLHKEKRIELIITSFNGVQEYVKDAHLIIVGQNEDGTESICRNLVQELGLQDKVHFTGMLRGDELLQAYVDSDLFVLLSYRENFGMSAAEAMASGLPIIIGKEVGIASFIKNEQVGKVIDVNSDELINIWIELCNSESIRKRLGENARKFIINNFSDEIIAKRMCNRFEQAINH